MTWLSDDAVTRLRAVAEQPDLTGTRYELVRELGRGGMGVVYEVFDRELGRAVAMKVIAARHASEARTVARLEHPGIVPVHDAGQLSDGRMYYTMKLVRGVSLARWAGDAHPRTDALRLFARVCEPVAFAHAHGVVHRDLKPENVMVGEFGAVLVMDWGVAHTGTDEAEHRMIVGTLGYMPPEQARGESVDARSDVFALGAMLRVLVPNAPKALNAISARAMSANAAERYPDARALRDDVLRFLDGEPVTAYRENIFERASRWIANNRVVVALLAAYLLMRAIVFLWARL